jgi:hypothetical protein
VKGKPLPSIHRLRERPVHETAPRSGRPQASCQEQIMEQRRTPASDSAYVISGANQLAAHGGASARRG